MARTSAAGSDPRVLKVGGRAVTVTHPDKIFFSTRGHTKLDLVQYYLAVAPGALIGVRGRPMTLKRYPDGAAGFFFFQKRAPTPRPPWIKTCTVSFPSGRSAEFAVCSGAAQLAWIINLGCIDLNPWPIRATDIDHPDELRVDLDPTPTTSFADVRRVALLVREVLEAHGLRGFPKTSGSRGIHVNVRIEARWGFQEVRRAALALAREVERRAPQLATSKWWKEERHGVFIDYNQNARDRTVASAYSVRPNPEARISCPLEWSEVAAVEPDDLRLDTVPARFKKLGDPGAAIDRHAGRLDLLLDLAARDERGGLGDAPWPPHFPKQAGEPPRVQPSRRRATPKKAASARRRRTP